MKMEQEDEPLLHKQKNFVSGERKINAEERSFARLNVFLKLSVPYFRENRRALFNLIVLIILTLVEGAISIGFTLVRASIYNALNERNVQECSQQILYFMCLLVVAVPLSVYRKYLGDKMAVDWREKLTDQILEKYYANRTYFILEAMGDIDNPDQRITEDVNSFTKTSLVLFFEVFDSIIGFLMYSVVLFRLSPTLFGVIFAYTGAGTAVALWLGSELSGLYFAVLMREANLRFGLVRTRENAEAIAFYDRTASSEKSQSWALFASVVSSKLSVILLQRNLGAFTTSYEYLAYLIPILVIVPQYFDGKMKFGDITKSTEAFYRVRTGLGILIRNFEDFSSFSAGMNRLSLFLDRISQPGWKPGEHGGIQTIACQDQDALLKVSDLTVLTPDGSRVLLGGCRDNTHKNIARARGAGAGTYSLDDEQPGEEFRSCGHSPRGISFSIHLGDQILIVGASGSGKSSLLRTLAGLWEVGYGKIVWDVVQEDLIDTNPNGSRNHSTVPRGVMFLPQKPYCVIGSLRQQIMYPQTEENVERQAATSDNHILELLRMVSLERLAGRMGGGNAIAGLRAIRDWGKVLSLGEQQRLAFARVLFNRPYFLLMDESTSALDSKTEEKMFELLRDPFAYNNSSIPYTHNSKGSGLTYVTVGHNASLLAYHTKKITINGPFEYIEVVSI